MRGEVSEGHRAERRNQAGNFPVHKGCGVEFALLRADRQLPHLSCGGRRETGGTTGPETAKGMTELYFEIIALCIPINGDGGKPRGRATRVTVSVATPEGLRSAESLARNSLETPPYARA